MAYTFKYRIQSAPVARNDGTGGIDFDLYSVFSNDAGVTWATVPGYHRTIVVWQDALKVVNDMAQGTTAQKNAKGKAVIALLKASLGNAPAGNGLAWTDEGLLAYMTTNDAAALECERLVTFVNTTLNLTFPIDIAT